MPTCAGQYNQNTCKRGNSGKSWGIVSALVQIWFMDLGGPEWTQRIFRRPASAQRPMDHLHPAGHRCAQAPAGGSGGTAGDRTRFKRPAPAGTLAAGQSLLAWRNYVPRDVERSGTHHPLQYMIAYMIAARVIVPRPNTASFQGSRYQT